MTGKTGTIVALAVAALMLLPACAGPKGPPDPAKVQEKLTAEDLKPRADGRFPSAVSIGQRNI